MKLGGNKKGNKNKIFIFFIFLILIILGGLGYFLLKPTYIETEKISETEPVAETFHGKTPNCPEKYCVSLTVNGDLLFHPGLWNNFKTGDEREFDFSPLFDAERAYYAKSDFAVCDTETPIAEKGDNYVGYPVFNIPPQVLDGAKFAGYNACTIDTNHSIDQGVAGISRMISKLDELGISHTGAYLTEEQSKQPMILSAEGGKLAIVGGTVSLNGSVADTEWRVDRFRDNEMHDYDYNRMITSAKTARKQGANIIVAQLHSVQEYITTADSWQIDAAHELIDSGEFDFVYFHGSHSVQPIEEYNGKYIVYGLGNSVTVAASDADRFVNDQGLTVRATFASGDGEDYSLTNLSYLPTYNKTGNNYAWCPLIREENTGFCTNESRDNETFNRMRNILYSRGVSETNQLLSAWKIWQE